MSKKLKRESLVESCAALACDRPIDEKLNRVKHIGSTLSEQPFLFVDCQTTGATPARAHLLEVGWTVARAVDVEAPTIVTRLIALPEEQILPPRIQKLTGISEADMMGAVSADQVITEIQKDLSDHDLSHAVAHWAQFEKTFLKHYFEQFSSNGRLCPDFICTCQIAKRLYPDLPSRAIRAVGGYFGLSVDEMKRAQGHVEITFFIWQNLVRELDQMGLTNASDLLQWLMVKPKAGTRAKNIGSAELVEEVKPGAAAKFLLPLEPLTRLDLPDQPGVYRLLNRKGKILYVGKATSLKSRVNSYFTGRKGKDSKTKELISQVFDLHVSPLATPLEAALLENDLIKEHDPPYNRALKKRGRSLVYFSRDFTSVSPTPDDNHVLGPFPQRSTIEPLLLLHQGLETNNFAPGLFWGMLDPQSINRAITLFFAQYFGLDIQDTSGGVREITPRKLLALGMALHRRQLLDGLQLDDRGLSLTYFIGPKAAEAEDEDDMLLDEAESNKLSDPSKAFEQDESVDQLTDEDLVLMVRSLVIGAARAYAMARTLTRLLNTTILYEEKKQGRRLIFVSGILQLSEDFDRSKVVEQSRAQVFKPSACMYLRSSIDLATYDRMRILLAEVRRVYTRGNWISVTEA